MTDTPKKLIIDVEKGTQMYVDLTAEEIQQRELDAIEAATRKSEEEVEAARLAEIKASRDSKLSALGLTAEELAI